MGLHGRPQPPPAADRKGEARCAPCSPEPTSLVSPLESHSSLRHPSQTWTLSRTPGLQSGGSSSILPLSLSLQDFFLGPHQGTYPLPPDSSPQCLDPVWCPILSSPPLALQVSDRPTASAQRPATAPSHSSSSPSLLLITARLLHVLEFHPQRHHRPQMRQCSDSYYLGESPSTDPNHNFQPQLPATAPSHSSSSPPHTPSHSSPPTCP